MRLPQIFFLFFIFSLNLFVVSCVEDKDMGEANKLRPTNINENVDTNTNVDKKIPEEDIDKLEELINLPFEPEFNDYREDDVVENNNRTPGPKDRKLTAILKFPEDDTKKLIEKLKAKKEGFETKIDVEPWFPQELVAKSDVAGDGKIKGIGYSAEDFSKSPYNDGSIVYIEETNHFVLLLQTK